MADSDITVSNLIATPALGMIILGWAYDDPHDRGLPYLRLDEVEVYASQANNRGPDGALLATRVAGGIKSAIHAAISTGSTWFFWIRARDASGNHGVWYPLSATNGVSATAGLPNGVTANEIANAAVTASKVADRAITADKISVSTLSAIAADLGTVNAGTINGIQINSSRFTNSSIGTGDGVVLVSTSGRALVASSAAGKAIEADANAGLAVDASSNGTIGVRSSVNLGGNFSFYASGGSYGPFTAAHDALIRKRARLAIGDVLVDCRMIARSGISDAISEVVVADRPRMRTALGVLASRRDLDPSCPPAALSPRATKLLASDYRRAIVNALGEGLINVCARAGAINAGDLLVTSDVRGKAMRQDDDIVRAWTVARARESVTFKDARDTAQIACIYLCG